LRASAKTTKQNILDMIIDPVVFETPEYLSDVWSWHGHIPFAFWCIAKLRPKVFVELGAHKGDSYFSFCQAVRRFNLGTSCYAVDTWKGDDHAGHYDDVYNMVRKHNDKLNGTFSKLIHSTFDDALDLFEDGQIDLLHIDGFHSYEAVKHDFESYRPKLSANSIVLFHDTHVKERGFGVWKFWDEITREFPSFTFSHSHGLGVLLTGCDSSPLFQMLATCPDDQYKEVSNFFALTGNGLVCDRVIKALDSCEQYAKSLECESDKLRTDAARDVAARDEAIARGQTYAASLASELEKVRTDAARDVAARDEAIARGQTYAASLASELEKVRVSAEVEISTRDRMLCEKDEYISATQAEVAALRLNLDKREQEYQQLVSVRDALSDELEKLKSLLCMRLYYFFTKRKG